MIVSKKNLRLVQYYLVSPIVDLLENLFIIILLPIIFYYLLYTGDKLKFNILLNYFDFDNISFNSNYKLNNYIDDKILTPFQAYNELFITPTTKLVGKQRIVKIRNDHCSNWDASLKKESGFNNQRLLQNNNINLDSSNIGKLNSCSFLHEKWDDISFYEDLVKNKNTAVTNIYGVKSDIGSELVSNLYFYLGYDNTMQNIRNQVNNFLSENKGERIIISCLILNFIDYKDTSIFHFQLCIRHINETKIYTSFNYKKEQQNNDDVILLDEFRDKSDYTVAYSSDYRNKHITYDYYLNNKGLNYYYWKHLDLNADLTERKSNKNAININTIKYLEATGDSTITDFYFSYEYKKSLKYAFIQEFNREDVFLLIVYYSFIITFLVSFFKQAYLANVKNEIFLSLMNLLANFTLLGVAITTML